MCGEAYSTLHRFEIILDKMTLDECTLANFD
jgi:hypothetical protein